MELRRQYLRIETIVFDDRSYIEDHILHVCKQDIIDLVKCPQLRDIEIDIALPGTSCRVMNVGDVVQPYVRLTDEAATFPGRAGEIRICGNGTSLMLTNVAVAEVLEVMVSTGTVLDMIGPGTEVSDLCKMNHLTIDAFPAEDVKITEYQEAMNKASKVVAKFLATLAKGQTPDSEEVFTLKRDNLEGLPRVAFLCNAFCHAPLTDMTLYGESMQSAMPVILHPNEILDGAVTDRDYGQLTNGDPTIVWQNSPIILDLYKKHGTELNFVGVVLNNTPHTVEWKIRNAAMASAMVHYQLKADGCIVLKEGGGHPQVDVGMEIEDLENLYGIKTVVMLAEFLSPNNGAYEQVLFSTKKADAMVSTGCQTPMDFPAMDKVIGHATINPYPGVTKGKVIPNEAFAHRNRSVRGCMGQQGWSNLGSRKF